MNITIMFQDVRNIILIYEKTFYILFLENVGCIQFENFICFSLSNVLRVHT